MEEAQRIFAGAAPHHQREMDAAEAADHARRELKLALAAVTPEQLVHELLGNTDA